MSNRKIILLTGLIIILSGCSTEELSDRFDCKKMCEKEYSCRGKGGEDTSKCISQCEEGMPEEYYQRDFIKGSNRCMDEGCDKTESCIEELYKDCKKPDFSKITELACKKYSECNNKKVKECVSASGCDFGGLFVCVNDYLISELKKCINELNCQESAEDAGYYIRSCISRLLKINGC